MNQLSGPDPHVAKSAGWQDPPPRKGFFTDTSICIGCKACEVACKEWNAVPEDGLNLLGSSYDNTGALGASTWRHVAFIEQPKKLVGVDPGLTGLPVGPPATDVLNVAADDALSGDRSLLGTDNTKVSLGMPAVGLPGASMSAETRTDFRWLMSSDVCKHCTNAACLDVCPTGSLFRTEFGTVVVQEDICNGCGYCVPACPFGVIDRRIGDKGVKNVGIAQKALVHWSFCLTSPRCTAFRRIQWSPRATCARCSTRPRWAPWSSRSAPLRRSWAAVRECG
jgi:formate dehydrogenase iron-sulfur subunit